MFVCNDKFEPFFLSMLYSFIRIAASTLGCQTQPRHPFIQEHLMHIELIYCAV